MRMFASPRGLFWCTLAMVLMALPVLAQTPTAADGGSDGRISCKLALGLYESVSSLLGGNLGLILGLILVFMGLWALIQGAKLAAVIPLVIVGALMTALPSLIESNLKGLGTLLNDSGISAVSYTKPTCPGDSEPSAAAIRDTNQNNQPVIMPTSTDRNDINSFGGNPIDHSSGSI